MSEDNGSPPAKKTSPSRGLLIGCLAMVLACAVCSMPVLLVAWNKYLPLPDTAIAGVPFLTVRIGRFEWNNSIYYVTITNVIDDTVFDLFECKRGEVICTHLPYAGGAPNGGSASYYQDPPTKNSLKLILNVEPAGLYLRVVDPSGVLIYTLNPGKGIPLPVTQQCRVAACHLLTP
jgi:hypothetical protein